ncbi:MAG: hypothetical protein Q9209_004515 [Squamulea sp. 1 TL-2023]
MLISNCIARPAHDNLSPLGPSPLDGPSGGFPVQYLPLQVATPSRSSVQGSSANLTLPFIPGQPRGFSPLITYIYSDRPRGFELASSIASSIYHYWKDTENQQIRGPIESQRLPFSNFLHTVQPSTTPGAVLNPLKVGTGYCFLLQGIIDKTPASWPGHMAVRLLDISGLWRRKREIGTIMVDNFPLAAQNTTTSPSNSTALSGNKDGANELSASIPAEKRWLTCFSRVLLYCTRHSPSGALTDDPTFPPDPKPVTYYWPCGHGDDELTLTVFPAAHTVGLTWDSLVRSMLVWVNKAALEPYGASAPMAVIDRGVKVAVLRIHLGREGGSDSKDIETL